MSTHQDRSFAAEGISAQAVVDYLREHPEFFQHNPGLLVQMQIPHQCGSAVSLLEYQVSTLRDQNHQMKRKLKELVQVGRENDRLNERMLHLTQALVEASTLADALTSLEEILRRDFKADAVSVRLFDLSGKVREIRPDAAVDRSATDLAAFENFFTTNRPLCGRLKAEQLAFLFGSEAQQIGSAALIPLGRHGEFGMLAVGSHEQDRFHPGMGTIFLSRLSLLLGSALHRYLDPLHDA